MSKHNRIERDKILSQASKFCETGDCFLHTTMKNGAGCQTILAGDPPALVYGIVAQIHRISEITGASTDDIIHDIKLFLDAEQPIKTKEENTDV